mmetsp:Transcript_1545/g.2058  ORF Transcript_1545/g.2058 Transcript_1545/m.2058 type:complete len:341 (-) Transcript_1545:294-1316(-)
MFKMNIILWVLIPQVSVSMRTIDTYESFKVSLRDREEVLVVSEDMKVPSTIFIGHNTSISSENRKRYSFDGDCNNQIMIVTGECDVLLEDLEFKNGYTDGSGGGLSILGGAKVTLVRCIFTSSHADTGGAVYISSSDLIITDSILSFNSARDGSAIYASFGIVKLLDTTIKNNNASHNGGGIMLKSSHCDSKYSRFQSNSAMSGGAFAIEQDSVLTSDENFFEQNVALIGGAIFLTESTSGIMKSIFKNGEAEQGGAIAARGSSLYTLSCNFRNNTAQLGGALWYDSGDWIDELSVLTENSADMMGGGIFLGQVVYNSTGTFLSNNEPESIFTISSGLGL